MENIQLINNYKLQRLNAECYEVVEELCKKCADYYMLHNGVLPTKEEVEEIFNALPPNKQYEDKFVLGIYTPNNTLAGIIDIVRDFPNVGEWMLGFMLITPEERRKGLGKIVHKSLVEWATSLGANSFRIGVIKKNTEGIHFWSALGYKKIEEVTIDFTEKSHLVDVMTLQLSE